MSIQFLQAEQQPNQYYFKVLLDSSKTLTDGTPDSAFVREYTFPLAPPSDQTTAQYLANIKDSIGAMALYELAKQTVSVTSPTPLSGF